MSSEKREFDLIIFGATGYTGSYVVRELVLKIKENPAENGQIRWAVAGRNLTKLADTLITIGNELDQNLDDVVKIQADVKDPESLLAMARRTTLVVNVVGPYRFFGAAVVGACVEAGTHHVDISGEPYYIEQTQLDYHQKAIERKLVIVSACGWDSIPCDMGVDFLKRNFDGQLHSVETFVQIYPGPQGYKINYATLESAMHGFSTANQLRQVRRQLQEKYFPKKLPKSRIILERKTKPFRRPDIAGWNVEFPGSDRSIVQRTQLYNYNEHSEPPVQIQTYFTLPSFKALLITIFLALTFKLFAAFECGRNLLGRYPGFFTCGAFSRGGPTRQQLEETTFSLTLVGRGWSKEPSSKSSTDTTKNEEETSSRDDSLQLSEPSGEFDKKMKVVLTGKDPGYIGTAGFLIAASLTILKERSNMPVGGVLTTASAFRDTKLMERLQKSEITIKVSTD